MERDNTELLVALGLRLKARRAIMQLSQKQLALRIGVDTGMISQYEAGKIDIPYSRLHALAVALGTSVASLTDAAPTNSHENAIRTMLESFSDPYIQDVLANMIVNRYQKSPDGVNDGKKRVDRS